MKYKGYEATIEYDNEDHLFIGRVINIKDIIVFDSISKDDLEEVFHHAIDDYLTDCEALNKQPNIPISLSA